ncbi:MAG: hypothetical protein HY892_01685 [Deltaproteobacteria bacterium]|nr:hypothetical protein [Deltaproteobacteria bacterium]
MKGRLGGIKRVKMGWRIGGAVRPKRVWAGKASAIEDKEDLWQFGEKNVKVGGLFQGLFFVFYQQPAIILFFIHTSP